MTVCRPARGDGEGEGGVQLAHARERAGAEQEGKRGQREPNLLGQDGNEEHQIGVLEDEGQGAVHGPRPIPDAGPPRGPDRIPI